MQNGRARAVLFDNQREGIRRMHNSSEACAGERGADTGAVMYLHEQTPGYKCEVTDEKIRRKGPACPLGSRKDMCCITAGKIRKNRAAKRKARKRVFPLGIEVTSATQVSRACFRTAEYVLKAGCDVRPPAYVQTRPSCSAGAILTACEKSELAGFTRPYMEDLR